MEAHKYGNNVGPSWTISFGAFKGGELWIEKDKGKEEGPYGNIFEKGIEVRGERINTKNRWLKFDGCKWHCVTPAEAEPQPPRKNVKRSAVYPFVVQSEATGSLVRTRLGHVRGSRLSLYEIETRNQRYECASSSTTYGSCQDKGQEGRVCAG
eukprot:3603241-Amphidinium_carterae.2